VEKRKFLTLPGLNLRPLCHPAHSQLLHQLSYPGSKSYYKTLIRPVLTYALETKVLSTSDEKALVIFERKVLMSIYGTIKDSNEWRIRYNYEMYALYADMDI
jgi:hypothetical protein